MRILIASTHTIPCFSGGWTTPLDLLGKDHSSMYLVLNYPAVSRLFEGVRVVGVGACGPLRSRWNHGERYRSALLNRLFSRAIIRHFREFRADFVMCLDVGAGVIARSTGLPYAMRFHTAVEPGLDPELLQGLISDAVFSTAGPGTDVENAIPIPHNQDLSRFRYVEPPSAERAVLLTSINPFREPEMFVEGVMLSKNMKGDIVGTGPLTGHIRELCRKTGGRVRVLDPVPRLKVPDLFSGYQVGVSTVKKVPFHYQMKVNAYLASGLFTLAKPWTHIAVEAPELVRTFETAEELAAQLDWTEENWTSTLETRRKAREWVHRNYSVDIPRKIFRDILSEAFPGSSS